MYIAETKEVCAGVLVNVFNVDTDQRILQEQSGSKTQKSSPYVHSTVAAMKSL